ncbi:hypothetical protein [Actinocrinis sp.]|uniref:hypothetical protein n=1 Tax=Actinocrinis sp. TaxID=1920516 RepID=UPI002D5B7839|nr:hypothetical protein [Actinocrinis sp.]HZP50411.1 hypothetical protein [Actinocrinis sp.]
MPVFESLPVGETEYVVVAASAEGAARTTVPAVASANAPVAANTLRLERKR